MDNTRESKKLYKYIKNNFEKHLIIGFTEFLVLYLFLEFGYITINTNLP